MESIIISASMISGKSGRQDLIHYPDSPGDGGKDPTGEDGGGGGGSEIEGSGGEEEAPRGAPQKAQGSHLYRAVLPEVRQQLVCFRGQHSFRSATMRGKKGSCREH